MCVVRVAKHQSGAEQRDRAKGGAGDWRADHNRGLQLQNAFVTAAAASGRGTARQADQLLMLPVGS